MPELPEIETIKRILEPQLQGCIINELSVRRPEVISHPGAEEFRLRLTGQTFVSMTRRGKFLILTLGSGDCVILHLRMTGCLLLTPSELKEEKHTHVVFRLIPA